MRTGRGQVFPETRPRLPRRAASGTATSGGNERQMMLQLTENNTGSIRRGEVTFRLNSNGLNETHTLTVEQAPTSKVIN